MQEILDQADEQENGSDLHLTAGGKGVDHAVDENGHRGDYPQHHLTGTRVFCQETLYQ